MVGEMELRPARWRATVVGLALFCALWLTACGTPVRTSSTQVPSADRVAVISLDSLAPRVGRRSLTIHPGPQLNSLIQFVNRIGTITPPGPLSCGMSTTWVKLIFRARPGEPENAAAEQQVGCLDFKLKVGSAQILLKLDPLFPR
jgi:hypothetical protein